MVCCRKAAAAKRTIHGAISATRRSGMSSTPPNATNSRPKGKEHLGTGKGLQLLCGDVSNVAEGSTCRRGICAVDQQYPPSCLGQCPRDRAPDNASADNGNVGTGGWSAGDVGTGGWGAGAGRR